MSAPRKLLLDAGGVLIADSGVGALLRAIATRKAADSARDAQATYQDVFDVWISRVRERFWSGCVSVDDAKRELCDHFVSAAATSTGLERSESCRGQSER